MIAELHQKVNPKKGDRGWVEGLGEVVVDVPGHDKAWVVFPKSVPVPVPSKYTKHLPDYPGKGLQSVTLPWSDFRLVAQAAVPEVVPEVVEEVEVVTRWEFAGDRDYLDDHQVSEQVARTYRLLFGEGTVVELRCLGASKSGTVSGYYNNSNDLARDASRWSGIAEGVYLTLQRIAPELIHRSTNTFKTFVPKDGTTKDEDVIEYIYLPIDFDSKRPAGISSTDVELQAAIDRAVSCRAYLRDQGFPEGLLAQSGNGAHLLYRIALGVADKRLLRACLARLGERFGDAQVGVDQAVFNPARVWKLYGTLCRKGTHSNERPHRHALILDAPETMEVTPREALERLAGVEPTPKTSGDFLARIQEEAARTSDEAHWLKQFAGDLKTLDIRGLFEDQGLEVQADGSCTCPWEDEHTTPPGGTRIWDADIDADKYAGFNCMHDHCTGRKIQQVLEKFGREAVDARCSQKYEKTVVPVAVSIAREYAKYEAGDEPLPSATETDQTPKVPVLLTPQEARKLAEQEVIDPFWGGIQFGMLAILGGLPNSGKSVIVRNMVVAAASGEDTLWGLSFTPAHFVLLDPENRLSNALKDYDRAFDGGDDALGEMLTFVAPASLPAALDVEYVKAVVEGCRARGHDRICVVIDTFRALHVGDPDYDERHEKFMSSRLAALKKYANSVGAIILVLHHHSWGDERTSGSTAIWGSSDAIFAYHRKFDDDEGVLKRVRARGNDEEDFPGFVLGLDPDTRLLVARGTLKKVADEEREKKQNKDNFKLLTLFRDVEEPGLTIEQVGERMADPSGVSAKQPKSSTRWAINPKVKAGLLKCNGTGKRGDPFTYLLTEEGRLFLLQEEARCAFAST